MLVSRGALLLPLAIAPPPMPFRMSLLDTAAAQLDATTLSDSFAKLPDTLVSIVGAAKTGDVDAVLQAARDGGPSVPIVDSLFIIAYLKRILASFLPRPSEALLEGTVLSGRKLRCAYRASRDGWKASQFHKKVDFQGPGIVIGTAGGNAFAGYNPNGWYVNACLRSLLYRLHCLAAFILGDVGNFLRRLSTDDYYGSVNAFLAVSKGGEWIRLPKLGGSEASVFDYARSGPHFGSSALVIGDTQAAVMGLFAGPDVEEMSAEGNLKRARSRLGQAYARGPPPFSASVFGGATLDATLLELEVWVVDNSVPKPKQKITRI